VSEVLTSSLLTCTSTILIQQSSRVLRSSENEVVASHGGREFPSGGHVRTRNMPLSITTKLPAMTSPPAFFRASPPNMTRSKTPLFLLKTKTTPEDGYEVKFRSISDSIRDGPSTPKAEDDIIHNFDPIFIPVMEHVFVKPNLDKVKGWLSNDAFSETLLLHAEEIGYTDEDKEKEKYGGIIFTSQRAVEAFGEVMDGKVASFTTALSVHS
jgi:hypothetical protein